MNLNNKRFVTLNNRKGLASNETVFQYYQNGKTITGSYKGGAIVEGLIVGKQIGDNKIQLLYQCLTDQGELKAGQSTGIVLKNAENKLELKFEWNWINGTLTAGHSEYIEIE
ncbi:hypothetical protein DKG77_01700 [Flagellimonas aquimarina]|uniref:N-acetylglutamate synthase n=1 Tax=Flagellimonas aquimarina TaxID=2201895 RepID=A0A316L523_9FLAO|nr:hypothetical protein DKG77_01700 [Allomuricauda koreensis]